MTIKIFDHKSLRPLAAEETKESIYSNFDHELDNKVVKLVETHPNKLYAQHAAWNFCGYVWFNGQQWKEEVWQWNSPVEILVADTIKNLIDSVNAQYGYD